ncbi:MAG: thioredoxin family protein [Planctomycetaceae bacterium]
MAHPAVVSREDWLVARKAHLKDEKEFTRLRDRLSQQRRQLPWVKIEKNYVFDGPGGPVTLAELFDGRHQLLVYHFMFAPEWSQGCRGCSLLADHFNPAVVHLQHRDATFVAVSRAPVEKLLAFRERMEWRFPWVSSLQNDFNHDYRVYFTEEERSSGLTIYNYDSSAMPISDLPGLSVFYRNDSGQIFHTYSTYARGLDLFITAYNYLDICPKGRDEEEAPNMSWVRHHDRYDLAELIDPWQEHQPSLAKQEAD